MRGNADESARAENSPRVFDGEFVLTDMHAIRATEQREVGPVVHDEQRLRAGGGIAEDACAGQQLSVGQVFVAKLNRTDPRGHQRFGELSELRLAAAAVDEDVELGIGQSLKAGLRDCR